MSIIAPSCQLIYKHIHQRNQISHQISNQCCLLLLKSSGFNPDFKKTYNDCSINARISKRSVIRASSLWPDLSKPSVVEMESISDCDHLDRVLDLARQSSQPIVIDWMANWCRKCIYLLPKLEKLAAEYDTKIKFYRVDVNNVPQSLVKRGNISKMPTIQLWKDGEMKAEVIGGHKAWLVMEEVRDMIKQYI